jgi:N4-(beta-N-acetylglucosaminyl)-L-asparaginase
MEGTASVVGTWKFSCVGVEACAAAVAAGADALTCVERGITAVELDESVTSAGYGGLPNAEGVLQLDAAVMTGDGRVGAVAALEKCNAAMAIACHVLRDSRHTLLAGEGATAFANEYDAHVAHGSNLSHHAQKRYREYVEQLQSESKTNHCVDDNEMPHTDTVGMICRDTSGNIAVGCATSGMQFKEVGRVGDSPVVGGGLFADKAAGAAVASGDGDQMIRFCIAFLVVESMRNGLSPDAACDLAMSRVFEADPNCQAAVCAMDMKGVSGASCTRDGFYIVQSSADRKWKTGVTAVRCVIAKPWKHTCL